MTARQHSKRRLEATGPSSRPVATRTNPGSRRGASVPDDELAAALAQFLRDQTQWPTYRDFERAGLKSLRDKVTHQGGARHWAQRLGVSYVEHPPGHAPIWTDDRIRNDLRSYLAAKAQWPSRKQFERDGHKPLRDAVNRTGGPDRWAAEFGLPRSTLLSGTRRAWTPEVIETRLRELIGNGRRWPSRDAFYSVGLGGMLASIYTHEGPAYWAKRLGVEMRSGYMRPRPRRWTEDRIRDELTRFCAGREAWPTEREFIAAGKRPLYSAASRNGGVARWAAELGLPRHRSRVRPPPASL